MSLSISTETKSNALDSIKTYTLVELKALLEHANLPRQGHKRDLLQRCKLLITTNFSPHIANKIQQINNSRPQTSRSRHLNFTKQQQPIVLPKTPPLEVLPQPNHIQFINLPFFEKMRTIDSVNMPVDWQTFSPIRFVLNETDIVLIRKNSAKVFLRIAPTILNEKHNDILPPFLFVQCNNQIVINNNITKQVGSQAHSTSFPTDMTDKIILKANASNTINFFWVQSPTTSQLKNLPNSYTLSIQLVHCVSLDTLFDLVVKREPYSNKTNDDNDSDIEIEDLGLMTTQQRVSLLCPITQSLIVVPAKSTHCSHLTCFDLKAFLQMNERRLQWTCPLCKKSASFETLRVDQNLQSMLSNVPTNCSTVEIDSPTDFQYILDNIIKQEKLDVTETLHLQTNNNDNQSIQNSSNKCRQQSDESDCIVLSSGSEESEDDDTNHSTLQISHPWENENHLNKINDNTSQSSRSTLSPIISPVDDNNYWEDIAQITYDLSSDTSEKFSNRKRNSSSTSSLSSCSNDDFHRKKRTKRTSKTPRKSVDIEIITLSSSDDHSS